MPTDIDFAAATEYLVRHFDDATDTARQDLAQLIADVRQEGREQIRRQRADLRRGKPYQIIHP